MNPFQTFFYSLKKSLFDSKYYKKDIAKASFWFSYKYLLFLLLILVFIRSFSLGALYLKNRPFIQPRVNRVLAYAEKLYPANLELKLRDGKLLTNVKEPYIYDLDHKLKIDNTRHLLVIDTKGSIENYPTYNTYVLATRNAVVYPSKAQNNNIEQTSVYYFSNIKQDVTLNQRIFNDFLNSIRPYANKALFFVDWLVLIFISLYLIFGSVLWASAVMFGLLIMTFFVWIVNLIFNKKYNYGTLYRFGMHAVTWPIIISEVMKYFSLFLPGVYLITFFIFIFIVLFS